MLNNKEKILFFRTLLGYFTSIALDTKTSKEEDYLKITYKINKKIRNIKKEALGKNKIEIIQAKLKETRKYEEIYFSGGYWNAFSISLMILEHLAINLNDLALKNIYLDVQPLNWFTKLETSKEHKELQKQTYRYFGAIMELSCEDL